MFFDVFLKIEGIPGDSNCGKHPEWMRLLSYRFGVQQPASLTVSSAGGTIAEPADFTPFCIKKAVDKASPKLFEACLTRRIIKEMVMELCFPTGAKEKFMELRMENALICSYYHDGGGSDSSVEDIYFVPAKISMIYCQRTDEDGNVYVDSVSTGWDLLENKVI